MGKDITNKLLGVLGGNGAKVSQIALVAHEHDDDVGIGVVAELLEPVDICAINTVPRAKTYHRLTFSYVGCLEISYTSRAPTAPR